MGTVWSDFLRVPTPCGHAVQVYEGTDELAASVAAFLGAGFKVGEPAVVVATPQHWTTFAAALDGAGWDAGALRTHGILQVEDADATLARFMQDDGPSPTAFEQVVGGVLDRVAARFPGREIRAFGEMVDLLCERGELDAAVALEELWNDLARSRRFSLLCAYHLDVFDLETQRTPLPHVCRVHSHVLPAPDPERLARAVGGALDDVLGSDRAAMVYSLVGEDARKERVPVGQLALMWISANLPELADRILTQARRMYFDAALAPAG